MHPPIRRARLTAAGRPVALSLAGALALVPLLPPGEAWARPTPDSFADLVEQVAPAVVQISTRVRPGGEEMDAPEPGAPPFGLPESFGEGPQREFLERFFGQQTPPGERPPEMGLGSGFIVSTDGLIVTNNHVVGGAERITVRLADGREYKADLLGADPKTDLAVLRISADGPLPVLSWGQSDQARVGDWVLAVGNPFGLEGTVTAGILSSRGRDAGASPYVDYLQIDAPLNRGNSGGPLLDKDGRVIGVNTAILSPNGGSIGIGFAIPSETAAKVVAELGTKGSVDRGFIGIAIQPVTPDVAESLGLSKPAGALIASVQPDSPAAKAGLRPGDVVLALAGQPVKSPRELSRAVADTAIGQAAPLTLWRGGKEQQVKVTIGEMAAPAAVASTPEAPRDGAGIEVAALGLKLKEGRDGHPGEAGRVVVAAVDRDKDAAEKGIRPGDVIRKVNDRDITVPADVTRALDEARSDKRQAVLLLIENADGQRFVPVRLATA